MFSLQMEQRVPQMNPQMMKCEEVAGRKPSTLSDLSEAKPADQQLTGDYGEKVVLVWPVLQSLNLLQTGKINNV